MLLNHRQPKIIRISSAHYLMEMEGEISFHSLRKFHFKNIYIYLIFRNYSSGGEGESSFEELAEASELPNDNRIFLNIKIPRTEVCTLPGEGQHSVYCIVYDGIYTAVSSVGGSSNPSSHGSVEEGPKDSRLVLKSRTVRRRFRQFMQLHSQLEASEDPAIVQAIRSIRGPSKWLNLPFR